MAGIVVVTTSYPEHPGDAQGHFVAAEVRRLTDTHDVTVLAPGRGRQPLGRERVVSLGGGRAFGFPGALPRLRENPLRALAALRFVSSAALWLQRAPSPQQIVAHFLLPCGVPLATRSGAGQVEIVVHGSDARLFAALPMGKSSIVTELLRARAQLRFVSTELQQVVLGCLHPAQREPLSARCRVEPCAIDIPRSLSRAQARAQLGIEAGACVAIVVARLVPGKRVAVALAACERVPRLHTIVVGDGPDRPELQERFRRARFIGQIERPRALTYLAAADVLVSASLNEGAPTVVREARALGTPVVCLEAGDLRRWAQGDPGLHVISATSRAKASLS